VIVQTRHTHPGIEVQYVVHDDVDVTFDHGPTIHLHAGAIGTRVDRTTVQAPGQPPVSIPLRSQLFQVRGLLTVSRSGEQAR
jgi:hypothetical protein